MSQPKEPRANRPARCIRELFRQRDTHYEDAYATKETVKLVVWARLIRGCEFLGHLSLPKIRWWWRISFERQIAGEHNAKGWTVQNSV